MILCITIQHLHIDYVIPCVEESLFDQKVDKLDYSILVEYLMVDKLDYPILVEYLMEVVA